MTVEVQRACGGVVERQLVLSAWRTLSFEHRSVLFECYFCGASVAEAAEKLGLPAGTVKSRTYYALRSLREAIDAMGGVASDSPETRDSLGKVGEC